AGAGARALLAPLALLALLARPAGAGMDACYDGAGRPQRCLPEFENAAFGRRVRASHTCGSPPEDFCPHVGAPGAGAQCQRCNASDPRLHHNATYLTDFHSQDETTWWQSPSMAFGVQYPNSVNLTLRLGKAYEITYVRLKFHTSRPESFAIYKRSREGGPWEPYQYYSASCQRTYGRPDGQLLRRGQDERVAFCTSEFSDISPLSGGNVAFSTLEGRPSAYNFEDSPTLQEWVTSTELRISLDRLNTFGDDIFKDPRVLQSYYYAIADFSVGGRCKCNGHASECGPDAKGRLVCRCQHHTAGPDCERCKPFFQDRPWARGTAGDAHECQPCNCSGHADACAFDRELFRLTGHGGRCLNCRNHTAGQFCERCQEAFYRWDTRAPCRPCDCHPAGSLHLQCDSAGTCSCKDTVTGWKCDRCLPGFHSLSEGGCRPCSCSPAGSAGTCDPRSGRCACKENVEGGQCDRCRPGTFNLQPHNPSGCSSCFCYGHSRVCSAAPGFREHQILSDFLQGAQGWRAGSVGGPERRAQWSPQGLALSPMKKEEEFIAPDKFLGDQRLSYGQPLTLTFRVPARVTLPPVRLWLEGAGLALALRHANVSGSRAGRPGEVQLRFLLQETSEDARPPLPAFHFQRLLANLTALRIQANLSGQVFLKDVQLTSARQGLSPPASWVETCSCPPGYTGQFCESCAPGYKRETPLGGPYASCVPCTCNQHGTCDPHTGICRCDHHTEGPSCERCQPGFYGNPFAGRADDCQPCPCPGQSACTVTNSSEVVCTHCPPRQRGRRCEVCDDGFFGDPLGLSGRPRPCQRCQCNGNVDPNAVGNCDPHSGRCLRCLYNTTGSRCEHCAEGFYGSALSPRPADKCQACSCHPGGSVGAGEDGACDPVTGQCTCLPHVEGRDCSSCRPGFHGLQHGRGCQSCKCHPLGSRSDQCNPQTGQCPCRPGVGGPECDKCLPGFFGFSIKGCRACRCSPLGSVSAQCRENSTCVCRPGFVGYKCDRCQENFFPAKHGARCQQCPTCYGLVKAQADKLRARLALMESWLQGSGCSRPWGPLDVLYGDDPRGDAFHGHPLPQEVQEAFLEQVMRLEDAVTAIQQQLRGLSGATHCVQAGAQKTCTQLAELEATLESTEEEILHTAAVLRTLEIPLKVEAPGQLSNWSQLAMEAGALGRSHRELALKVENTARKALLASHTGHRLLQSLLQGRAAGGPRPQLEDRYQEVQAAWRALDAALTQALPGAESVLDAVQQMDVDAALRPAARAATALAESSEARDLELKAQTLEEMVSWRGPAVSEAVQAAQAAALATLNQTEPLTQLHQEARAALAWASSSVQVATLTVTGAKTLQADLEGMKLHFPRPQDLAALSGRAGVVRDRLLADSTKKIKQAERMLGNAGSVSAAAQKKGREAELLAKDSARLARSSLRKGRQEMRRAGRLSDQAQALLRRATRQTLTVDVRRQELEEVGKVASGLEETEQQIRKSRLLLEGDIRALSELLARLGSLDAHLAPPQALAEARLALGRLQGRLSPPGALQGKLALLEREARLQEQQLQQFESELATVRQDKRNLEAILRSLPQGCPRLGTAGP
ncbi:laminin subunit gamma-3, partial [Sorex araneus]|uniref:laminin subunit gamma-3 n=1 Tax=Sorex araneus TaxID=42254 RepID=UPI002433DB5B